MTLEVLRSSCTVDIKEMNQKVYCSEQSFCFAVKFKAIGSVIVVVALAHRQKQQYVHHTFWHIPL